MYVIGDPRKLSEYMVKTGGRLMPDLLSREEMRELPVRIAAPPYIHTYIHTFIHAHKHSDINKQLIIYTYI